jgi:GNAT superfamily N-acetyltransferase
MMPGRHENERPAWTTIEVLNRGGRSAYPTGGAVRRAWVILREEGWRSFWFKTLAQCGYRRLLLLERALDRPIADFTPALEVDVAMLAADEIDAYLAFRPEAARPEIAARLRAGEWCFVAWHDRRIVAAAWIAARPVWVPFLGCDIETAPGEAQIYDKFTLPAFRGRGIANAVRTRHLRYLRDAGFRRAIGAVLPENASSLRDDARGGFRVYGTVARVKLGPWQRTFRLSPPRRR